MKQTRPQRNRPLFAAVSLLAVVTACPLYADTRPNPAAPKQIDGSKLTL